MLTMTEREISSRQQMASFCR